MTKKKKNRGLGKGLSSLLGDLEYNESGIKPLQSATRSSSSGSNNLSGFQIIPIEKIRPNPNQPRKNFDPSALNELAQSIKQKGILQPLIVKIDGNQYIIIAGERRWRAAQIAKLHELPVIIQNLKESSIVEIALIENIQREDLNIIEEAKAYQVLVEKFNHKQQDIAKLVGKSRSYIANTLRLLTLSDKILENLSSGLLSAGHARTLITAEEPEKLADLILNKKLSVREAEKRAKKPKHPLKEQTEDKRDIDLIALEKDLTQHIGLTVTISYSKGERGEVKIRYLNLEQLDDICKRLSTY